MGTGAGAGKAQPGMTAGVTAAAAGGASSTAHRSPVAVGALHGEDGRERVVVLTEVRWGI